MLINEKRYRVLGNNPCFAGHFPGNPIVPGVVILDYAQKQLLNIMNGYRVSILSQAKFTSSIGPDEDFLITLTQTSKDKIKVLCTNNSGIVMTGYFVIECLNNINL